jgi:integrase/recombinase XerC/integrase/recombinase XerD
VAAFLDTFRHAESAGTRKQYGSVLGRLARSLGEDTDVAAVTAAGLDSWMLGTFGERSPATWNLARTCLRSAWAHFGECGWADPDAGRQVRARKAAEDRDRAIPRDVAAGILADGKIPLRERCLWTMLYETAARVSEVLRLDVQDVGTGRAHSARVRRKAGAHDVIVWQSRTAGLLPRMLAGRRAGPLFTTTRKAPAGTPLRDVAPDGTGRLSYRQAEAMSRELTASAPGGPYTLHQWRHLALTLAAAGGASTPTLLAYSGQTSVSSLLRYARVSPDDLAGWQAGRDPGRRH